MSWGGWGQGEEVGWGAWEANPGITSLALRGGDAGAPWHMSRTGSREPTYEADTLRIIYPVTRSACRVVDLLCLVWTWALWQGRQKEEGGYYAGGGRQEEESEGEEVAGCVCLCVCVRGGRRHLSVAHTEGATHLSCPLRSNIYINKCTQIH